LSGSLNIFESACLLKRGAASVAKVDQRIEDTKEAVGFIAL
jgi:hypothetical protein